MSQEYKDGDYIHDTLWLGMMRAIEGNALYSGLAPSAMGGMTTRLATGIYHAIATKVTVGAPVDFVHSAADGTYDRWDLIYGTSTGQTKAEGTPAIAPSPPDLPAGAIVLYLVRIRAGITVILTGDIYEFGFTNQFYDHKARHLPTGTDPLATGIPSDIGTANTEGTANALTRQDHIHNIPALGITTGRINDLAVTTGKINDLAVTTGKINDLAVTTGKINDLAVTTGKILPGTNGQVMLTSGGVSTWGTPAPFAGGPGQYIRVIAIPLLVYDNRGAFGDAPRFSHASNAQIQGGPLMALEIAHITTQFPPLTNTTRVYRLGTTQGAITTGATGTVYAGLYDSTAGVVRATTAKDVGAAATANTTYPEIISSEFSTLVSGNLHYIAGQKTTGVNTAFIWSATLYICDKM